MGIKVVAVLLATPQKVYQPGDVIQGTVQVQVSSPTTCEGEGRRGRNGGEESVEGVVYRIRRDIGWFSVS